MAIKYTRRYMRENCTHCCIGCPYIISNEIYKLNQKLEKYKIALEEISEYVTEGVEFDSIRLVLEDVLEGGAK